MTKDLLKRTIFAALALAYLYPALGDWWALVTDCYGTSSYARCARVASDERIKHHDP